MAVGQANTFGSLEIGCKDADAAIGFSEDGLSWSRVAHHPELFGDRDNDLAAQTVRSLTTFGDLVVAVGDMRVHSRGQMLRDSRRGPAVPWVSTDGGMTERREADSSGALGHPGCAPSPEEPPDCRFVDSRLEGWP